MAFELITVLIVLAAILVALRPGVLLNSVYAFAEIMNMQSIRESLDNEDPASYEYYQQLASVSDNNYYMIEVFDPDGNTVYSNREKFLYSGDGDSVYYRTAESMYTTGRSGVIPSDRLCADISRRGVRDYTLFKSAFLAPRCGDGGDNGVHGKA